MDAKQVKDHPRIDDPCKPPEESGFIQTSSITKEQRRVAFSQFGEEYADEAQEDVAVLHHALLPGKNSSLTPPTHTIHHSVSNKYILVGLLVVPALVPPAVQKAVLERMLHRDLSNPDHQTNLHLHYHLPYPSGETTNARSLFALAPTAPALFTPRDPSVHKPLTPQQVLSRRLHWVTLGGQYDWTARVYPARPPPAFPADLARFLGALFPATDAQAAIVNLYTPGDTMMMHRDVSELTDKGLVSLSFGCDGLFMIAPNKVATATATTTKTTTTTTDEGKAAAAADDEKDYLLLRLRSGDAIYMTQESRCAWHGVPKIVPGTCPEYLENWPAQEDGQFSAWEGWMKTKRINLNVRQMQD
ncbi:hypothetical protein MY4038_002471 [Beauveria bassiana]